MANTLAGNEQERENRPYISVSRTYEPEEFDVAFNLRMKRYRHFAPMYFLLSAFSRSFAFFKPKSFAELIYLLFLRKTSLIVPLTPRFVKQRVVAWRYILQCGLVFCLDVNISINPIGRYTAACAN